jgi:trigger factor
MSTKAEYRIDSRQEIEATIEVSIPADQVEAQIGEIYKEYAREVRIPGFRKGHVPRPFLDSRFGRKVFLEEARDELQRTFLPLAIDELDLRPVTRPELEVVSFGEAEPFVFRATFGTLPQVRLPSHEGLSVTVPRLRPVSEDDVMQALHEVQKQFGVLGEREGDTVSDGDLVRVQSGDQTWDVRAAADNPVTRALVGATIGQTVPLDETLPSGEPLKLDLEVLGLRQVVLPEIDDDLAKDAGFDDLTALKADIESAISRRREDIHRQQVDGALLEKLMETLVIPLPDAFVEEFVTEEIERIRASMEEPNSPQSFSEYLEQQEQTEEDVRREIRASVETRIRQELVLGQLASDLEISLDEDELTRLAEEDAVAAGEDPLRMVARLKAEDRWESYRQRKINDRIFATLRETAVLKEEEA